LGKFIIGESIARLYNKDMKNLLLTMFVALFMVGCGSPVFYDTKTLDEIIAEAIDFKNTQERGKDGDKLVYVQNQSTPYTGWRKRMDDNGQIRILSQYKDGRLDGLKTGWYENGDKKWEGNFKDGKLDGLFIQYNKDGTEHSRTTFKDDEKVED